MTILQSPLKGQVAVVTGGSRGIGRVYAEVLATAGAKVGVFARSRAALNGAVSAIRDSGGEAVGVEVDVVDVNAVRTGFARVEETFGQLDLLVNNAGASGPIGPAWEVDAESWWQAVESHVRGTFLCTQAALRQMTPRGRGRIVNIVSNAGAHRWPTVSAYSVAKAAQIKFTENVAVEAQSTGVKLFALHPGLVTDVGMTRDALDHQAMAGTAQAKLVAWVVREQAQGRTVDAARGAACLLALASGRYDQLNGRYITVHDDLDHLAAQAETVEQSDSLVLRVKGIS